MYDRVNLTAITLFTVGAGYVGQCIPPVSSPFTPRAPTTETNTTVILVNIILTRLFVMQVALLVR
jgi:hypothetical protein